MFQLRKICKQDCRLIWEWANDPMTRQVSFSTDEISWQLHLQWFESKLRDPLCFFYLGTDAEGIPVGQVRFEVKSGNAVISVNVDPKLRKRGYGSLLIRLGVEEFFKDSQEMKIIAYVKPDNKVSLRVFQKADFINEGPVEFEGHSAICLSFVKR